MTERSRLTIPSQLFLNQKYPEAAQHFRNLAANDTTDGEAAFLAAKAFEMTPGSEKDAAASDDWAKKLLTAQNRYAKLQQAWSQSKVDRVYRTSDQPCVAR